jgi:hypothetical protein
MDEKKMILILVGLLVVGFFSLFIIIVPWANWGRHSDLEAVAIDNLLLGLVGAAVVYGLYIGSKTR